MNSTHAGIEQQLLQHWRHLRYILADRVPRRPDMDKGGHRENAASHVKFDQEAPVVGAKLLADLPDIRADQVSDRVKQGTIATMCEAGVDDHEDGFRLGIFHRNRRARIEIDHQGRVFSRSVNDFGNRPLPASLRGPERTNEPKQPVTGNRS